MSPDVQRLMGWFDAGTLVRPRAAGRPTTLELMGAIGRVCGCQAVPETEPMQRAAGHIGDPEHLIFILLDGLGWQLLKDLGRGRSFLESQIADEVEAVFPSTTTVALTALTTGLYPCDHGFPGWWVFFENLGVTAELLPFNERFSKRPLTEFGGVPAEILCVPSVFPQFRRAMTVVTLGYLVNTTYSRYWSSGVASVGYDRISDGVDRLLQTVETASGPTFSYLYLPQLDGTCHKHGVDHQEVLRVFEIIDSELQRLQAGLRGRAKVVLSADHGHVNRQIDRHLQHDDALNEHLRCPPSGEPAVPVFHVKPGHADAFRTAFSAQFGDLFALLSIDEVEDLRLLGPTPLSARARQFFGDFMGIPPAPNTMHYMHPQFKPIVHLGVHSGLTPGEMRVPLIVF